MKHAAAIALILASPSLTIADSTPTTTTPLLIPGYVNRDRSEAIEAAAKLEAERTPPRPSRAQAVADAEQRAKQLLKELKAEPYHPWRALGGNAASAARIVDYERGIITVQRKDGSLRTLRESRLGKSDRQYFEKWKQNKATAKSK